MVKGYQAIVLHAHLPFVRHLDDPHALEERWLYEAISETYIPLIDVFRGLVADNIDFRVTISLSPPLLGMLSDQTLQHRFLNYLQKQQQLITMELERTCSQPQFHHLAQMYAERLERCYHTFHELYNDNLIAAFKQLQELGRLEIITCGATHGYFPLNNLFREGLRAQVGVAVETYKKHFGTHPKGFWLPECAYISGVDEVLKEYALDYFFVDTHGVIYAEAKPRYGVYAPIVCPSGVAAFGRDPESSKQVWSADEGYPGDFDYREYYRDIGYDLDFEYIKPFIHPDGHRLNTGIKYYRITEKNTDKKQPYNPAWAKAKAELHAEDFYLQRLHQVDYLNSMMDRIPIIVSPYDAELFGHWWFEGPQFLDLLIRKIAAGKHPGLELITPSDYLLNYPVNQITTPSTSSWGHKGYHQVWLEESNDWIYPYIHKATRKMIELANCNPQADLLTDRALKQAARELLLAQSSDWAFIMKTGTMVDYAVRRTKQHLDNFNQLYHAVMQQKIEEKWLEGLEQSNNIFPELDYHIYASKCESVLKASSAAH